MASSKLLKERIESIQDTRKITNAMYLISSSKLRKARRNYQNVLPYFTRMRDTISRVVPHLPEEPVHPYFHERQREDGNPRRAYLVLTADKGMAGSFNQNVLKLLLEKADANDRFYVIGQVGYRALRKDPRLVKEFQYGATAPSLQRARDITVDAIDDFKSGKLDEIYLIYTKIQNALTSEPVMERLLPLGPGHSLRAWDRSSLPLDIIRVAGGSAPGTSGQLSEQQNKADGPDRADQQYDGNDPGEQVPRIRSIFISIACHGHRPPVTAACSVCYSITEVLKFRWISSLKKMKD